MFIFINSFKSVLFKSIWVLVLKDLCLCKDISQCPQGLTPCSCIICLPKESMLCVCGCSSANYCLLRGWISTCLGLCVLLWVSNQTANWYSIKQLSPRLSHWSQHTELVTTSTSSKWTLTQGFTTFRKGIAQTYTMS